MSMRPNAVILARVSSKSQEDEGYSLDSQLKLLQSYFDNQDYNVIKVFKIAETASKQQSRKVFHELLSFIKSKSHNIQHLGVEKTDRLTRNFRDALAVDDWLEANKDRRLHAVKENLLLHKEAKSDVKFMWNIHLAVAKKYTDNLREEAMKGWAEKLAQGWLPASPPPGYMTIVSKGKRIHVPDPETSSLMKHVFELYIQPSHSLQSIQKEMDIIGIRTSKGRAFSKSNVQKILNNPFYIGINRFDGKEYPGAQQPIIDKDLFRKVQDKMHRNRPVKLATHNSAFKGMITCHNCNTVVSWQKQKGRYYGVCRKRSLDCQKAKFLREDTVESIIIDHLKALVCPSKGVTDWVASKIRKEQEDLINNRQKVVSSIDNQIARLKRMDSELYNDKLSGEIPRELYVQKHDEFMKQIKELEEHRDEIATTVNGDLEKQIVLLELAQKASEIYLTKTPDQKRLIISKLFKSITTNKGVISVKYTSFSKVIAQKVRITKKMIGEEI